MVFTALENTNPNLSVNIGSVLDKNITLYTISSRGLSIPAAVNILAGEKLNVRPFITRCNFSEVDKYLEKCKKDPNRFMFVSVVF